MLSTDADLAAALEGLLDDTDVAARLAVDPVGFVHRYSAPEDIEVAAFFSAQLAFGRVASFATPLTAIFDAADAVGGPRAWVSEFDANRPGVLDGLGYRWIRDTDFIAVTAALRDLLGDGRLADHFVGGDARAALTSGTRALAARLPSPTRGMRAFVASPAAGSACKRWCMFLRWMVRPADGIDFGLWTHLDPARLVIPLDTHVHRIARLVGLTDRKTPNWRTSEAVTAALRAIDPADPTRFDFALAHLGISGQCRSRYDAEVCPRCALRALCREGSVPGHGRRRAARR